MKYKNPGLIEGVRRMASLGYSATAVGQALNMSPKTIQLAALATGSTFGNRKFLPRMTRPLKWLTDSNKVHPNVRPMAKKVLRAMEFGVGWPLDALVVVYPGIGKEMLSKWLKWHTEEQVARGQMAMEIQRVEEGRPLKSRPVGLKYEKKVTRTPVRFDGRLGKWFKVTGGRGNGDGPNAPLQVAGVCGDPQKLA